ncbi:NAD(P)H-hydrate dehydratase [Flavobacterium faecale]|uniref:ADP-dependent (S)-NAD(P)H-hydrate dehydratase n=1 Tax=Flavobacterium faecale TaxID=1355330 RepID=A0A2S1LGQ1_9FLAO|nr:NAD(P)H-hydrate dehydratase [Flavobacterium faecale]AWG22962.1 NAD(P)H-hydrate dehydratase [Flavobacterium faecale]
MNTIKFFDRKEALARYKPVPCDTHKGIQGHALIVAGSYGKIGAAVLSSRACLKSGCGLVTAFIPKCGYQILQASNPEVMTYTDDVEKQISDIHFMFKPDAVGLGPGIGTAMQTQKAVLKFLSKCNCKLLIDADGLNILAENMDSICSLKENTILTPHQKELERLIGEWETEDEKMQKAIDFSLQHKVIIVMKGAPTHVISGATVYQNTTGNAALATAGSGDVLTGIITSLLAQSYDALDAALLGVYLHGLSADIAVPETGTHFFTASDCIDYLGKAFLTLEKS